MRTIGRFSLIAAVAFLAQLPPAVAQQDGALRTDGGPRTSSPNNETFKKLRAQCEQASCAPTGGDACAEAAAILLGEAPPDEFWQMNGDQKQKIALRLLEIGTSSSNRARARAFDLYSVKLGLFGGSPDPYRANELMVAMTASSYSGAALRKARSALSLFSIGTTQEDRAGACVLAKKLLAGGGLDEDSQKIAKEILDVSYCASLEPVKN